jgi:hypothetical protein
MKNQKDLKLLEIKKWIKIYSAFGNRIIKNLTQSYQRNLWGSSMISWQRKRRSKNGRWLFQNNLNKWKTSLQNKFLLSIKSLINSRKPLLWWKCRSFNHSNQSIIKNIVYICILIFAGNEIFRTKNQSFSK